MGANIPCRIDMVPWRERPATHKFEGNKRAEANNEPTKTLSLSLFSTFEEPSSFCFLFLFSLYLSLFLSLSLLFLSFFSLSFSLFLSLSLSPSLSFTLLLSLFLFCSLSFFSFQLCFDPRMRNSCCIFTSPRTNNVGTVQKSTQLSSPSRIFLHNTLQKGMIFFLRYLSGLFHGQRHQHINDVVTVALRNAFYRKELDRLIIFLLKRVNWLSTSTVFETICIRGTCRCIARGTPTPWS